MTWQAHKLYNGIHQQSMFYISFQIKIFNPFLSYKILLGKLCPINEINYKFAVDCLICTPDTYRVILNTSRFLIIALVLPTTEL